MDFTNLPLAASAVSPLWQTTSTLQDRNSVAMTATNSTCAIFIPGQILGPPDHGMNVPFGGVKSSGISAFGEGLYGDGVFANQRSGLKSNASAPQVAVSEWRAAALM